MWFELDRGAILVNELDATQRDLLDAVPLNLCGEALATVPFARLSVRPAAIAELEQSLTEAQGRATTRLELTSPPEVGPETLILGGEWGSLIAVPGHAMATLGPRLDTADVLIAAPTTLAAQAVTAGAVLSLTAERGYFPVHASMASLDGTSVMFLGERSRGKTSSCLALGRAGWTVLADDRCYVHGAETRPLVWGPGGAMRLRPDAARLWADLAEPMGRSRRWSLKAIVEAEDLAVTAAAGSATPRALFLPQVRGRGDHDVSAVSQTEALSEVLCSTGLVMLPRHAAGQFAALTGLVRSAPCYRLVLGEDMSSLPGVIEAAVA